MSLICCQMTRVISSPSISTSGTLILIFSIVISVNLIQTILYMSAARFASVYALRIKPEHV